MSEAKSLLKNTGVIFVSQILGNILSYLIIIALARYLGVIGFGQYAFVFAFIALGAAFIDLGVGTYFIIYVAKHKNKAEEYFRNQYGIRIVTATFCLLLPIIASIFIKKDPVVIYSIWLGAIAIFFLNLSNGIRYLFAAFEKFEYEAIVSIIERVIAFGLGIFLLVKYKSLPLFILALIVSYFSTIMLSFLFARKLIRLRAEFNWQFWKMLLVKGFPFFIAGFLAVLILKTDTVMLSLMKGDAPTGWYNAAYRLVDIISLVPFALATVLLPIISRLYATNKEKLKLLMRKSIKYTTSLAIPIGAGTFLLAQRIIFFVYKEQFSNSTIALQVLIWMEVIFFMTALFSLSLLAIMKQKYFIIAMVAGTAVNIILNIILIPSYSYIGAGIASVVSQAVIFVIMYKYVSKYIVECSIVEMVWRPIIASAVMALTIIYLGWLAIWWIVPIAIIVYFAVFMLIGGIEADDISLLKKIAKKQI